MPLEKFVYLNDNTTLSCEAIAEPAANFTWFHNKEPIDVRGIVSTTSSDEVENVHIINEHYHHRSLLHIKMANAEAFGNYTCQVTNRLGTIEQTIELKRGQRPRPPILVKLRGYNSHTFDVAIIHPRTNVTGTLSGHHQTHRHHNQHQSPAVTDYSMEIKGFRIEYIPEADFKRDLGRWTNAQHKDFANEEGIDFFLPPFRHVYDYVSSIFLWFLSIFYAGASFLLTNLSANTTYLVRAAARNSAGFSEWTRVEKLKTLASPLTNEDTSQTSSTSSATGMASVSREISAKSFIIALTIRLFTIMINCIDYKIFNKNYSQK